MHFWYIFASLSRVTPFYSSQVDMLHEPIALLLDDLFVDYTIIDESVIPLDVLPLKLIDVKLDFRWYQIKVRHIKGVNVFNSWLRHSFYLLQAIADLNVLPTFFSITVQTHNKHYKHHSFINIFIYQHSSQTKLKRSYIQHICSYLNVVQQMKQFRIHFILQLMSIFKRLVASRRQQQHEQVFEPVMNFMLEKASKISERTVSFVKKLQHFDQIIGEQLFDFKYNIKKSTISPICSKIMNQSQNYAAFRCYDCMQSVSSCICAQCFVNGNHKGHNYIQYQAMNGCCDCGNQESWNEKGFCKNHGNVSQLNLQIQPSIERLYLEQFGLAFWIYFYLNECKKANMYKQQFGNALFSYLATLCRQNYEMKYLAFKLLSNPLPVIYKEHDIDIETPILHRLFRQKPAEELKKFVQLTFQVFPVEQFRILVLQEYFEKMKKKGQIFTSEHPLAMLNYQFLSCVKLINKLIKNKTLMPLSLYPYNFLGYTIDLPASFKKYYEDLDYINNMRCSKQYHIMHLTLINICDMCYYRKFTSFSEWKKLDDEEIGRFNLDQLFLKTLGLFVKNIISQKKLIEKCLRQLFQFIIEADINFISLAHQRAFALLVYAYFDGNIYQLQNQETCKTFISIIFSEELIATPILKHFLRSCIMSKLQVMSNSQLQISRAQHEKYFLRLHPQKNFNQFLDISFHKIMIMVCKPYIDYSSIVGDTLEKMKQSINRLDEQNDSFQIDEQFEGEHLFVIYSKFYNFLNFINSITRIKIDQIVIANYIGISKQKEIIQFYKRLLPTFKNLTNKQFKNLALQIINNEDSFESFIKQCCTIEKGKIKSIGEEDPLQTCIYHQFFKNYQHNLKQTEYYFLKKTGKLIQFQDYSIFSHKSVQGIMENIMNYLFKFTAFSNKQKHTHLFSLICFEYFKIYLQTFSTKEKSFFQTLLQPSFRPLITKQLLEQITLIEKQSQQLEVQRGKIKDEKELSDKKKRQKLMAKKKEKQLKMKNAQAKVLNTYETNIKQFDLLQQSKECIYCKSSKSEQLNFISYIGLTNFYQSNLLKEDNYHVYFESCGHKIHRGCYEIVMLKNKSNYCFLCKRDTNILIPEYSQIKKKVNTNQSTDIFITFQVALINQRQDIKPEIKQASDNFLNKPQLNFYQLLVSGICKDILFIGLRDNQRYQRLRYLIHFELYLLLKVQNQYQIKEIFKNIKNKSNHKYSLLQNLIQNKLEELILGISNYPNSEEPNQYTVTIDNFFKAFAERKMGDSENDLNLFSSRSLFITLPQNLSQMNMYIGQCKICTHVTNYIYICLKCGWSSCRKCLNFMHKHSTYAHIDGTFFISCTNGAVKYLHGGTIFEDDSIYENYLGESYMEVNSFSEILKNQKFILNTTKLQKLQAMALEYGIHQKIFLNDH